MGFGDERRIATFTLHLDWSW